MSERLLDLGKGLAIWKVKPSELREQDKNARVMTTATFERLVTNIKQDQRLESLPLCTPNQNRQGEFWIISGHHRIRAARAAGIHELFVLMDESKLSHDQVKSKQLAHNKLSGQDDEQMAMQILQEIADANLRFLSGWDETAAIADAKLALEDFSVQPKMATIVLLFADAELADAEDLLNKLDKVPDAIRQVWLTDMRDYTRMQKLMKSLSDKYDVRSTWVIFALILKLARERFTELEKSEAAATGGGGVPQSPAPSPLPVANSSPPSSADAKSPPAKSPPPKKKKHKRS
jgi:ParB-like chromosome segregation protein Spo0J